MVRAPRGPGRPESWPSARATLALCIGVAALLPEVRAQKGVTYDIIGGWPLPPPPSLDEMEHPKDPHKNRQFVPECDCNCCTTEPCPCLGVRPGPNSKKSCGKLMCFTDKRPQCHNWVAQNMEVKYCNVGRWWNMWKTVNPYDTKFFEDPTRYKHDQFCKNFCQPLEKESGAGCEPIPLNTPEPTSPPCTGRCTCPPPVAPNATAEEEAEEAAFAPEEPEAEPSLATVRIRTGRGQPATLLQASRAAEEDCRQCCSANRWR